MTNDRLDVCPWCVTKVMPGGIGGMEPVLDGLRWWHQGCIADVSRAVREFEEENR